ncbi:hypothetical protein EG329_002197 [Mollisiaceae sp. DMI_Dod_QoI]|nr:hypothetical protein EG329_002197 [Helotiales sp. DMI_Dod_QoI]
MTERNVNNGAGSALSKRNRNTYTQSGAKPRKQNNFNETRGKAFKVLTLADLDGGSNERISIENYTFLASYNWCKDNKPTILVPGTPACWFPPELPLAIPKDDGQKRIEENKDRIIVPRWAPLFAALQVMQPTYSLGRIFLVIERHSLRQLFDFAAGRSGNDWRIDAEVVNGTLFLTRFEANPRRYLNGSFHSGYGHSFEESVLTFDEEVMESLAHHRIVEYDIGGMKWIVRFEADGYIHDDNDTAESAARAIVTESSQPLEQLSSTMDRISLGTGPQIEMLEGVTVIHKGRIVSPASVIEVKCKKIGTGNKLAQKMPQCWFSQTRHLFIGQQQDGIVKKVEKIDLSGKFEWWEQERQDDLRKLMLVVRKISEAANEGGYGKCCVLYDRQENPRVLRFMEVDNRAGLELTENLKEKFWGQTLAST